MGINANLFSQSMPPFAAPSIRFGDWIFSAPEPVTSNALLGLGGLESPGLYVVMAYDARLDAVTVSTALLRGIRQNLGSRHGLARELRELEARGRHRDALPGVPSHDRIDPCAAPSTRKRPHHPLQPAV